MTLSEYTSDNFINALFRAVSFTAPSTLAYALVTSTPTISQTGATIPEVANSNGYARVALTPTTGHYSAPSSQATANSNAITFPSATGAWGTVVGVAICDSATYGAGNFLAYCPLSVTKSPTSGDTPSIPIGDLTFLVV